MEFDFEKIGVFCVTKKQMKLIGKLKRKFSDTNTADLDNLLDLMYSFFVNENYLPFSIIIPELLKAEFKENFNIWGRIEFMIGISNETPVVTPQQKKGFFNLFESVVNYKSQHNAQEGLDNYFKNHLSLYYLNESLKGLAKALNDKDLKYEYRKRLSTISEASQVKIINQGNDVKLENEMNIIIQNQKESLLKNKQLLKYS